MATIEEADACVENLNETEIKGSVITVEKVNIELSQSIFCRELPVYIDLMEQ